MNVTSKLCLQCSEPIGPNRRKFCSQKCALKWHNAQIPWSENPKRAEYNARAKKRYWEDPEAARAKVQKWRDLNPDMQKAIERSNRVRNAKAIMQQSAQWRERNRENLRNRAKLFHEQTRAKTPWKHILRSRFRDALARGMPFELTSEWAAARWTGRCELSGIPFDLTRTVVGFYSPSIDKIDPDKGYLPDNCRFVLFSVNGFKSNGTDLDVIRTAKAIVAISERCPLEVISMEPAD